MTDHITPSARKTSDHDPALEAMLDELARAERAAPDAGLEARIAAATAPGNIGTTGVRLVHPPSGLQRTHRRLKIATGLAAAAAVTIVAVITLPPLSPSQQDGGAIANASDRATDIDDDVTYMLAAMDVWDTGLDSEVDLVLADAVAAASSLDAATADWADNWADDWVGQGDL